MLQSILGIFTAALTCTIKADFGNRLMDPLETNWSLSLEFKSLKAIIKENPEMLIIRVTFHR
jgi:hypothetical protein